MIQYVAMGTTRIKSNKISETLPPKPIAPEPYECCERGCDPCIYDYYAKALARWEKRVAEIEKSKQQ
jgi:hypothetical protein